MTRLSCVWRFFAVVAIGACCTLLPVHAATPESETTNVEADGLVRSALRFEAKGDAEYRRILLGVALNQFADFAPARWQTGHVRDGGAWRTLSEVEAARSGDQRLAEYFERRKKAVTKESAETHLSLARWCLRNELRDQARYHLAQVFRLPATPEMRQEAAQHLTFKLLRQEGATGVLVGEAELQRRMEEFQQAQAAWRKWAPELNRIAVAMAAADEDQRRAALDELAQINDPGAVAGLELLVSKRSDKHALAVISVLAAMPHHEATMSLARHALFSPDRKVRAAAIEQLAKRPIHDYAPWLLSGLISPVKSRYWVQPLPNGNFRYLHDFYKEDAGRKYVMRQDMSVTAQPDLIFFRGFGDPDPAHAKMVDPPDALISPEMMALELLSEAAQKQDQVLRQNVQAEFINKRIDAVLEAGAGQKMGADPVRWWEWWQKYNELQTPDHKQLVSSYSSTQATYPSGGYVVGYIPSCFPAGTQVWTETGARPIETIQGGDRVLAQDVETGELDYKTVLGTTIRPPTPLVSIGLTGGETISATKGHPFWVSGSGWKMAKFLESGERLHCIDGFKTIESIGDAVPKPAYNLIVEDFATYFVGKQRLLVHDNTLRAPTLATVPGLVEN